MVRGWTKREFDASKGLVGFCTSIYVIGAIIARPLCGKWIHRVGQTRTFALGMGLGLLLIQHSSFDSVIIACAVASAVGLLILPLLSVKDVELTADQVQETKGFKLSSYLQRDAVPIALVALVVYLCYASIVSFLALYTEEIRLIGAATFFFMVGAVVMFITRPFVGCWFDARGENSVMYLGIPCFALGIALLSQARSGWMLLLSAAVMSLGFGATQSSELATVVRIAPEHRAGLANSTFYVFADTGAGIGPLMCGLLADVAGYRNMYVMVAAVAAAGLVLYYLVYGRRAARR